MDDKRQLIIATARQMFMEQGFRATSLEGVAQRTGMGKASLYHYFENKYALFDAAIDLEVEDMGNELTQAFKTSGCAVTQLSNYITAKFDRIRKRYYEIEQRFNLWRELGLHYPNVMAKFGRKEVELLSGIFTHGVTSGEFKSIDPLRLASVIVHFFWGLQHSIIFQNRPDGYSIPTIEHAEEQTRFFIEHLISGILSKEPVKEKTE